MAKNYLNISELSIRLNLINKKTGKPLNHILRFWEKEFSEIKPVILKGNRRYYNQKNISILKNEISSKSNFLTLITNHIGILSDKLLLVRVLSK